MKTLDSLLKPFKVADEEILRQYTKITKKWEDKGHSRYSLSGTLDAISLSSLYVSSIIKTFNFNLFESMAIGVVMGMGPGCSLGSALTGDYSGIDEENRIITNPALYFYNKIGKAIRMPELISGIGFAGKGAYDIYNYFSKGDSSLNDGVSDLLFGVSLMSNASAWYIRNSDPKLLNKQSVFKTAYEKFKEKIGSLIPQPMPIPQPSALRNY